MKLECVAEKNEEEEWKRLQSAIFGDKSVDEDCAGRTAALSLPITQQRQAS